MGHVFTNLELIGTKGRKLLKGVLVDTGASLTVMPKELLDEVGGLRLPMGTVELELGDGRRVRADLYVAMVAIKDRSAWTLVAGFENAKPVVGDLTLELLGLRVNPVTGDLEETRPPNTYYFY
ncbi:hypothetical protein [Vulcanisaeta thermophila]|uniref:hypothetical protein n=1 Tax=Vulcanisaeta thermophila TaxID=867917 RepID=UPI0008534025|nr:hypothetical protein [Vulcanisaeta thermophila]